MLPLLGIFVGWLLKTGTDLLLRTKDEWTRRRRCVFFLLRAWKRILDYERYVSVMSKRDLDVVEFESSRGRTFEALLKHLTDGHDSLKEGIRELATVDPTAAVQLDNTLHHFWMLRELPLEEMSDKDSAFYLTCMAEHYKQIDWTLSDLSNQTEKLAKKSGPSQKRKVARWYEARLKGKSDFEKGIENIESEYEERSESEPPPMIPLVMPDYISEENWNSFLEVFPDSQRVDAPEFKVVEENLRKQIDAFEDVGIEANTYPVECAAWRKWAEERNLELRHETVGQFAMERFATERQEADAG